MPITDHEALDALCTACGIAVSYRDIQNKIQTPSIEVKRSLLEAIGSPVNRDTDIYTGLEKLKSEEWRKMIAPVLVHRQNNAPIQLRLTLNPDQIDEPVNWEICEESGRVCSGRWEARPGNSIDELLVDNRLLKQFEFDLPARLSNGYHQLSIKTGDNIETRSCLIVAPETCYQPPILGDKKVWGISLQLYSLRSKRNWGIGDFTDLRSAIEIFAPLGVSLIGLNPLHTLFLHQPENASPYSPSSRDFLNPIYLDIEAIGEFSNSPESQTLVNSTKFQDCLKALRAEALINYTAVWATKHQLLKMLYQCFLQQHIAHNSKRTQEFRQFQIKGGDELYKFGLFEALQAHFYATGKNCHSWQQWPEAFQDPDSDLVKEWAELNIDEIEFHQYQQWNAEIQLCKASDYCRSRGMSIGLYRDLAVGNAKSAAQCWAEQSQYAMEMGIGAPPDDFNSEGQNWALPPLKPLTLSNQDYRLFVNTLRANMRQAGALRIDHIMGLMRLFWVPPNCSPGQGTYVSYPFEDLLAILALESQRNHCLIIGEDLGTVPDEVRRALETNKILSYRILYFEKNWKRGDFKAPEHYPRNAICSTGSHDLPTLSGFWQSSDLKLRDQLKLLPTPEIKYRLQQIRMQDRVELLEALAAENLINDAETRRDEPPKQLSSKLMLSIQRYLARSKARVMTLQLEDLFLQEHQVNVPGTIDEHPNWRRKLSLNLEDWQENSELQNIAQEINRERNQGQEEKTASLQK
jgi:4-alpha-glucanotransferase